MANKQNFIPVEWIGERDAQAREPRFLEPMGEMNILLGFFLGWGTCGRYSAEAIASRRVARGCGA